MTNLLLAVFYFAIIIQLLYYLLVFSRLAIYCSKEPQLDEANTALTSEDKFVSVIICARNEGPNLAKNLPLILQQEYPNFEVIVVDDGSEDGSPEILSKIASEFYSQDLMFNVIRVEEKPYPGKKFPLSLGIAAAKGECVLLTDADCCPASNQWIRQMILGYTPSREIVLGFGGYTNQPGLLNKVIRYETFHTFLQYGSYALAGIPYMGVGRNLSYKRQLFSHVGGFEKHKNQISGDDDLLINAIANSRNTALCIHPDSFIWSTPEQTWSDWLRQKTRHISAGIAYRPIHQFLLGLYTLSLILTYVTIPVILFTSIPIGWVLIPLFARWLVQMIIFYHVLRRVNAIDLWYFSTIFDFFSIAYYPTLVLSARLRKKLIWR
jgi:glycosyltransferase involved in cell wall biosynthesis